MDVFVGLGGIYGMPDIVKDLKNNKAKRKYSKEINKIRKQLKKMNGSSRYKELKANLRPDGCPHCGCPKIIGWGVYWRKVKYFFAMKCRKKPCKRYRCKLCKATFSVSPQSLSPFRRYSNKALIDMVDMKLWTYAGYRKVGKWNRIHGSSHSTVIREIMKLGPICRDAIKSIICRFSSIVCIDEIYFRKVKGIHYMGVVAVDARYGRVILEGTYMANTPSVVKRFGELVGENIMAVRTDCIKQFIDDLLQIVNPKVIITDTKSWYGKVIDDINKYRGKNQKIKHFFCTLHVLWEINRYFKGYKKLKLTPMFENMKQDLYKVFEADTLEKAEELLNSVLKRIDDFIGTKVETVLNMLSKNRDRLFPFLKYGLNRTNNPVEHYNGFIKRFQHVSRKFSTLEGIRNLLSVYALFYNFMPKMEGLNKGIRPLEKAKWVGPKDMYKFINYPACVTSNNPKNFKGFYNMSLNTSYQSIDLGVSIT